MNVHFIGAGPGAADLITLRGRGLSVWSVIGEQLRRLRALYIPYDVTPGAPSFAAAASLNAELTLPGVP